MSGSGRLAATSASARSARADRGQPLFPLALQCAGNEPVLGLAGVELAAGALGVDLRAFELQLGGAHPRVVVAVGLLERA